VPCDHSASVVGEANVGCISWTYELFSDVSRSRIPKPNAIIIATASQIPAVAAKRQSDDRKPWIGLPGFLPIVGTKALNATSLMAHCELSPVRRKSYRSSP
jgi:hypothetical protein